jgi:hypothetical protein
VGLLQGALELLYVFRHRGQLLRVLLPQHPRVVYQLLRLYSLQVVDRQQLLHQVPTLLRYVLPVSRVVLDALLVYLLLQLALVVRLERWVPAQQHIEHDPNGPPVHYLIVFLAAQNFWSHVEGRPHQGRHEVCFVRNDLGHPEIDELDDPVLVPGGKDTVFGLSSKGVTLRSRWTMPHSCKYRMASMMGLITFRASSSV